ncbi:MAG: hypothetical protein WCO56_06060 [Verrucomicrobiota bacterium]
MKRCITGRGPARKWIWWWRGTLGGLRDFVTEHKARLGVVINNDTQARQYEENLVGLPFTWL